MKPFQIPYHEVEFSFARSRGPGGQNVNKTNSAVILRWNPEKTTVFDGETKLRLLHRLASQLTKEGDLLIRSEVHRDQDQNKSECLRRLHSIIQKALFVPKKRVATKPTKGSVRRRLDSKAKASEIKSLRKKLS